jgi:hypothetical protein
MWTIIYSYLSYKEIPEWEDIHEYERKQSVIKNWDCWGRGDKQNYTILLFSDDKPENKNFIDNKNKLIGIGTVKVKNIENDKYKRSVWIQHLEIYNGYQKKGYGKILLSKLEKISADDVANSPKKNYYSKIIIDKFKFYTSMGYDEIFMKEGDSNWKIRSYSCNSCNRLYAKSYGKILDQEKFYYVAQNNYDIFEHACDDGRHEVIEFLPFLDEFMKEDEDRYFYIFARIFNLSVKDFELIYRHMMKIKYKTNLETMEELFTNNHLLKISELCEFFEVEKEVYLKLASDKIIDFLQQYYILD